MSIRLSAYAVLIAACCSHASVMAQDRSEPATEKTAKLSHSPVGSTRNDGFGGALSPLADSVDATSTNPAAIRATSPATNEQLIKQLHFPYIYTSFNATTRQQIEAISLHGLKPTELQHLATDTLAGDDQYGRVSLFPNVQIGNLVVGPIYDVEVATVQPYRNAEHLDFAYQRKFGAGAGYAIVDANDQFSMGVFAHFLQIERLVTSLSADDVAEDASQKVLIKERMNKYQGVGFNAGMAWHPRHKLNPTVSLRINDVSGTDYVHTEGPDDKYSQREDLGMGVALSPRIFSDLFVHFAASTSHLTNENQSWQEKWHVGSGVTYGGRGVLSVFGLNAGVNQAGFAFGGHLNIGLIGVQYANFAVDVGTEDHRHIERRQSGTLSINLAQ